MQFKISIYYRLLSLLLFCGISQYCVANFDSSSNQEEIQLKNHSSFKEFFYSQSPLKNSEQNDSDKQKINLSEYDDDTVEEEYELPPFTLSEIYNPLFLPIEGVELRITDLIISCSSVPVYILNCCLKIPSKI